MNIRIAGLVPESIVDGFGMRYTLFTQGCPHKCPGCHNPQSWDEAGGTLTTIEEIFGEFSKNPLLKGITFSGGEPFCQPEPLTALAKKIHAMGKDVTTYSGYTYDELVEKNDPTVNELLQETDILIDGPYLAAERNLELHFRGSENQRIIDMNSTRETGQLTIVQNIDE